ncbi:TonB-like protein [Novosphingobium sp. PhB165]|uniref:energy transducer TonB n=1 Tax=Novosphingobium sp. PhB165 TaxID=2485105 RepID=UPI0010EAD201|nr:energy transducer TonB [Novosphingobium sp. PhB165]TCM16438.1 TonB-like protein [Novosphingobium sp. PhB165]
MLFLAAASAAAAPVAPTTLQEKFDAASALQNSGQCKEAIAQFEALEKDPHLKPGSFPASAVAVRKGICLVRQIRRDEGERAIALGLPALVAAGPDFASDVSEARMALGDVRMALSDRTGAAAYYRLALEGRTGAFRLDPLLRLARATAFDGTEEALAPAREALAIMDSLPEMNKKNAIAYRTLYARTLLNQGRAEEAYKELKQALALSGGLTLRTTVDEVSLRGDLAMAAMLIGRRDDARLYLAYTGAGRLSGKPFVHAESMDPPLCGEETGLRPDDVAVVEFGINDDGTVAYAQTVYSRGGPQVAAAFEQAVHDWYWGPDSAAAIPAFYRVAARVEVRCSNRLGKAPGLWAPMNARFANWAATVLPADTLEGDRIAVLARLHRLGEDETGAANAAVRVAALGMILDLDPYAPSALADKAVQIATQASLPAELTNSLRVEQLVHRDPDSKQRARDRSRARAALAAEPAIAADALAADTLLLDAAGERTTRRDPQTDAWVAQVAQDTRLPETHPLRQLAWLEQANRAAAAGNLKQAQTYYDKTGLTDEQCALLSLPPALRRTNVTGGDYPLSAMQMGFEGWVNLEYDINANGSTANVRPLVSYPPLIFGKAATEVGKGVQYDMSYRPGASTACTANTNTIAFAMRP